MNNGFAKFPNLKVCCLNRMFDIHHHKSKEEKSYGSNMDCEAAQDETVTPLAKIWINRDIRESKLTSQQEPPVIINDDSACKYSMKNTCLIWSTIQHQMKRK